MSAATPFRQDRFEPKYKFVYEYDFGDSWGAYHPGGGHHAGRSRRQIPLSASRANAACPPEDVGGVWGYEVFLAAIADPDHEEHEMYTRSGLATTSIPDCVRSRGDQRRSAHR
ncbi:MAG: hypothetical protein H6647_20830 [Anaerolineales bacterium]|nr:hypothetical protein [Anaerolineales bacterium]